MLAMKVGVLHQTSALSGLSVGTLTALTIALSSGHALAAPHSGVVAAGNAQISQNLNRTDIHQSSDRVVIDWKGFDLAADEITQFHQPSANAVALNRVNSNAASKIAGTLKANGQVVIVNPNGVLFEKSGKIDVGGLIATTADIDNSQFMQGNYSFSKASSNPDAAIVNEGTITAKEAGLVGLVAPRVENHGMITAKLGKIELASGDTFSVDLYGDGLFELAVSDAVSEQLVRNTGTLNAPAGVIAISAASGKNIVDSLIQIEGELSAPTVSRQGGKIVIGNASAASSHGTVRVSGKLKARGTSGADKGGNITITANQVAIQDQAHLDASGVGGGGTILIGGEYQGKGELATAEKTYIGKEALIQANSLYNGDGGEVIVWADDWTKFYGTIEAQGGVLGGDGGFVETSGKDKLGASGRVKVAARHNEGQGGSWLLDPRNIIIQDDAGGGPDDTGTIDADGPTFESDSDDDIVTTEAIEAVLNTGADVIVQTGAGGAQDGDITIANNIEKTAGGDATLTLKAHNNISNSGGADITSSLGALNIILNADSDANSNGAISLSNATITTLGGNFTAGGGADPTTDYATSATSYGFHSSNSTITTSGGDISILGTHTGGTVPGGVRIDSTLNAGAGDILVDGRATNQIGLVLNNATLQTTTGDITLKAYNSAGGIALNNAANNIIEATGSGSITLDMINGRYYSPDSGTKRVGSATMTGDITITTDSYLSIGTDTVNNTLLTQGDFILQNRSAGVAMGIGTASNGGTRKITDDQLATLSAGHFIFGASNGTDGTSGDMEINTAHDFADSHVTFKSGADIELSGTLTKATGAGTVNYVFEADENIINSGSADIVRSDGTINLTLNSDKDANDSGAINLNSLDFVSNNGFFTAGGGADPTTTAAHASQDGVHDVGVTLAGVDISTGTGNILIRGEGETTGTDNYGVYLSSSANITTTSGNISMYGQGGGDGAGAEDNHGIYNFNNTITTTDGNITLNGTGGNGGHGYWARNGDVVASGNTASNQISIVGQGDANSGLSITNSGAVSSTGIGASSATISLSGTSNDGSNGVYLSSVDISSVDGDISVVAVAGDGMSDGLRLNNADVLESTGAADITINSTGAIDFVTGTNQRIGSSTMTGDIDISLDSFSSGDLEATDSIITNTGSITIQNRTAGRTIGLGSSAGAANITLDDTALGALSAPNYIFGSNDSGDVEIDTAHDFADSNVTFKSGADIELSGTLTKATGAGTVNYVFEADENIFNSNSADIVRSDGTINLTLNADKDADSDGAIALTDFAFTSNDGTFTAGGGADPTTTAAHGAQDGVYDVGVELNNADISTGAGAIIIRGEGEDTNTDNYGVSFHTGSSLVSDTGDITIVGKGGDGTGGNIGVRVNGTVQSTGTTASAGDIRITGTGGTATHNDNIGIRIGSTISADAGDIILTGISNATSGSNSHAINFNSSQRVETTTSTSGLGNITLNGTANGASGDGVYMHVNSRVVSDAGVVNVSGDSANDYGVQFNSTAYIESNSDITVTGIAASDDGIILTGTTSEIGRNGTANNVTLIADSMTIGGAGVTAGNLLTIEEYTDGTTIDIGTANAGALNISDAELALMSAANYVFGSNASGDVEVNTTHDFADSNVTFKSGADIELSGTLTKATGAGTVNYVFEADENIFNSNDADIVRSDGTINLTLNSDKDANDSGAIALTDFAFTSNNGFFTAGGGADPTTTAAHASQDGVYDAGVSLIDNDITTGTSAILVRGEGEDSGDDNYGVSITGGSQLTTTSGNMSFYGQGGLAEGDSNTGIFVNTAGTRITTDSGTLHFEGTGGSDGTAGSNSNTGVEVNNNSGITSNSGAITLIGTGGDGDSSNRGVYVRTASIETADGDISITGTGAAGASGGSNVGVYVGNGSDIISSNNADITMTGIAGPGFNSFGVQTKNGSTAIGESGGNNMLGDITLIADSLDLADAAFKTDGTITIEEYTDGTTIDVGTANAGALNISDAELALLDAANYVFGSNASGNLEINTAHDFGNANVTFLSAADIDLTGAYTNTGTGDLTLDAANTIDLDAAITAGGAFTAQNATTLDIGADITAVGLSIANSITTATASSAVTLDAGTGTLSIGTNGLGAGANDLTLLADAATIAGNVTTTGTLTIEESTDGTTIGLGTGAGTLSIDNTELGLLSAGDYVFGSTNTGDMEINTTHDFGNSDAQFNADTAINVTGALTNTGSGQHEFRFADNLNIGANITTNGGQIIARNSVDATNLTSNVSLDAGSSAVNIGSGGINAGAFDLAIINDEIQFNGEVNGTGNLSITTSTAGTDINLNNGSTDGLDLSAAELARIGASTDFANITIGGAAHTGTLNAGAWTLGSDLTLQGGAVDLAGALTMGANDLTLTSNAGKVIVDEAFTTTGAFSANATGDTIDIGVDIDAAGGITLNDAATLTANTVLDADTNTITLAALNAGANDLTLVADEMALGGDVDGSGDLSLTTTTAGTDINLNNGTAGLDISAAELARIGASTDFANITIGGAAHTGTLNAGAWTLGSDLTLQGGAVDLAGALTMGANDLTLTSNAGKVIVDEAFTTTGAFSANATGDTIDIGVNIDAAGGITLNDSATLTAAATLDAGSNTITLAALDAGANALELVADEITLNGDLDGSSTLIIRPDLITSAISLNDGNTTGLDFSAVELARIGATTDFSSITIGGATHTGALGVGDWTVGSDLSLSAGSIALGGNVNAGANTLNVTANSTDISYASGTLSADSLNLDAQGTMNADVNIATALDIAANSTAATLTGLFQVGNTQTEADLITGGPGNDANYTFEGYTIREIVAAAGGGGGGGGGAPAPVVTPTVPETPVIITNDEPSSPTVSDGQNGSEIERVTLPKTLDADIQKLITRAGQVQPNASFTTPRTTPVIRSKAPVSAIENRINISPEAVDLFDLEQNEILF